MSTNVNVVRQEAAPGQMPSERPIPEWAEKARRNIDRAVVKQFGKLFVVKQPDPSQSTDAFLFVSASDEIKTASRRAMDTLGFAYGTFLIPVLYVTVVPMVLVMNPKTDVGEFNRQMLKAMWMAGLMTIKLEIANLQSGDILWSFTKESRSGYDLRNPDSVESLIVQAVEDLSKTMSRSRASD